MLTWINEKAKWVIVIFAAGIAVGLLAMDRVPNQAHSYPVGEVNDHKITYAEFDSRVKMIVENQFRDAHPNDEQYTQIRNEVFRGLVRQILMQKEYGKSDLRASVAELRSEFKRNPDAVRARLVQEAQQRLYSIQRQATSQEDANQRAQAYIATLPRFLTDSTFDKADYDAWLDTREAFQWGVMLQFEEDLKNTTIPMRQLQMLVGAGIHPTTLESEWIANRRETQVELQVAVVPNSAFEVSADSVSDADAKAYFEANKDSFFVAEDAAKFLVASIPVAATSGDEERIKDYAMTIYNQLTDSSVATTFEDLARVSSEDLVSAEKGGLLSEDFVPKGSYVKEFEDAAYALDSGAISLPVRTRFGFHIIKSYGKTQDSAGVEMIKAAHILLVVNASSETVDSLERILSGIKADVDAGKDFAAAAKERNVNVFTSNWIDRGSSIEQLGYLKGVTAYAWPNENLPEEASLVSPVLKNDNFVAILLKTDAVKPGERSFAYAEPKIKSALARKKSTEACAGYLASVADKVKAYKPAADSSASEISVDKVNFQTLTTSLEGYVQGFGYANPQFAAAVLSQKEGEWGPVIQANDGAVMMKVVSKKSADEAAIKSAVSDDKENSARFSASSIFNQYVSNIENGTAVKSNLDLYYKD